MIVDSAFLSLSKNPFLLYNTPVNCKISIN